VRGVLLAVVIAGCGRGEPPNVHLIDAFEDPQLHCPFGDTCNPLTQTGCNPGERCTWILSPGSGCDHIGCEPDGTMELGSACTFGPVQFDASFDDCKRGAVCSDGICKKICDPQALASSSGCDAQHACNQDPNLFDLGPVTVAGVCEPACDPLTQTLIGSNSGACDSTDPTSPDRGCYTFDFEVFSCSVIDPPTLALTDRTPAKLTNGSTLANSCAPGFVPFFFESTGSMSVRCAGLCAPLEIDNTQPQNAKGDPTVLAKLPLEAALAAGNATCAPGKKGSEAQQDCVFLWSFLTDIDGNPRPSRFNETLGVCFAYTHFQYDSNGDTIPDTVMPACESLPPRTAATPGDHDDAADFGCQKIAHSTKPSAMRDFRLGYAPGQAIAHTVR
jgi:hypothetical protein